MPIIKSAKKRVRVARKATIRNSKTKRSLRTAVKAFHAAITNQSSSDKKAVPTSQSEAQSNLDKAAKKGIIHKNKASRLKSQLAAKAKAAGATPVKKEKTAKTVKPADAKPAPKATVKKAAPKTAAKSAAVKKAPAKKPAAK